MRVPVYSASTVTEQAAPVTMQRDAPAAAFGAPIAQGLANVSDDMQKIYASDALAEANKINAETRLQWTNHFTQKKQTFQTADNPSGAGFTDSMLGEFDKYAKKTLEGVKHPNARLYLQDNFNNFRTSLGESSFLHESKARHEHTDSLNATAYDARKQMLIQNPDPINFIAAVSDNNAAIDAHPYLSPAKKDELKRKQAEELAGEALMLDAVRDAPALLQQLNRKLGVPQQLAPGGSPQAALPANLSGNQALVAEKAAAAGMDPAMMLAIAHIETGGTFKADAKNPQSSAGGLFQFVDATWTQYGKGAKNDVAASTDAAINLAKDNTSQLAQSLGRAPQPWEVYLAHQQGAGGARAILAAAPDTLVSKALTDAGVKNAEDAVSKNGMAGMTVAQAQAKWQDKYQKAEKNYRVTSQVEATPLAQPTMDSIERDGQSTGDPRIDSLPPKQLLQLFHHVQTLSRQQEAVGKIAFEDQLKSSTAKAYNGIPDAQPIPEQAFLKFFGAERGPIAAREYRATQQFAGDVAQMATIAPTDALQIIQKNIPNPNDPGYAEQASRLATLQGAWQQVQKQREDDAGGYVLRHSQPVAAAYSAMSAAKTPEHIQMAAAAFAQASLAEQQRLGIQKQGILPAAMAEQVATSFSKDISNGDNTATRIAASEMKWGAYWPTVYRQLATNFKDQLPDSFLLIPGLSSAAAKEEVARLDHIKMADLEKQLPAPDLKSIREGVQSSLAPFAESLFANQTNSDLYKAMQSSAEKMAMARVTGGASVSSAVKASVASFIGQYEFSDSHSARKYLIPTTENPTAVRIGLDQVMENLPALTFQPPPDATGMRKPEEMAAEWKDTVAKNPLWITNEDQSGIKLFAIGKDGRPYQVKTGDGAQVQYKWADLRSMAARKQAEITARGAIVAPSDRTYENMAIAAKERERNRIMNMPLTPEQRAAALERLK